MCCQPQLARDLRILACSAIMLCLILERARTPDRAPALAPVVALSSAVGSAAQQWPRQTLRGVIEKIFDRGFL